MAKWETASVKVLRKLPKENLLRRLFINANDNLLFSLFISLTMHTHTAHWEEHEIIFFLIYSLQWSICFEIYRTQHTTDPDSVMEVSWMWWTFHCDFSVFGKKEFFSFSRGFFVTHFLQPFCEPKKIYRVLIDFYWWKVDRIASDLCNNSEILEK